MRDSAIGVGPDPRAVCEDLRVDEALESIREKLASLVLTQPGQWPLFACPNVLYRRLPESIFALRSSRTAAGKAFCAARTAFFAACAASFICL
jgi:hypothetical protein